MSMQPEIRPDDPRWKRYEKLVARMYSTLSPGVRVTYDDRIMGWKSGVERQIDVSLRTSIPGSDLLVVVQCRDYDRPLDVNDVGGFISVVGDVGANKGVMVAQTGFTPAAKKMATAAGIDLLTLVDAENKLWSEYFPEDVDRFKQHVSFPVAIRRASLAARLAFPQSQRLNPGFQVKGDVWRIELRDAEDDRILGTLLDIVGTLWANRQVTDDEGEANYLVRLERPIILSGDPSRSRITEFIIGATVNHLYHVGRMPVGKLQGFYNHAKGSITIRAIELGPVSFDEIIRNGAVLTKDEAATLSASMGFDISDAWAVREGFELFALTVLRIGDVKQVTE